MQSYKVTMSKRFKSVNFYETEKKSVATINGLTVIKDVVIVQSGVDKVGDLMDDDFIKSLATQGNLSSTGIKCRGGHPNMCKDSLGTYIGDFHNFSAKVDADGQMKCFADLYIADIAKKTQIDGKGISYHDYVVDMATNHPDKLGNSIVFMADEEPSEIDGKSVMKLTLKENGFIASDIVDSPAATDGLFKSDDDLGVKLTEFLDENPDIYKAIDKNPSAIEIFFKKYIQNSKHKDMTVLKSLQKLFGIKKSLELTDASGAVLTIETDAAEPAVGDAVTIGGSAAADGEYIMPDNSKLIVVAGKISEIVPAPAQDPTPAPADTQMADVQKSLDSMQKAFDDKLKAIEDKYESQIQDITKSIEFLGEQIKSGYTPEEPEALGAGRKKEEGKARFTIDKEKLQNKIEQN